MWSEIWSVGKWLFALGVTLFAKWFTGVLVAAGMIQVAIPLVFALGILLGYILTKK